MKFFERVSDYFSGKTLKLSFLDSIGLGILLASISIQYLFSSLVFKARCLFSKSK